MLIWIGVSFLVLSLISPKIFSRIRNRRTRFVLVETSRYLFAIIGFIALFLSLGLSISATVVGIIGGVLIYVLQKPILNIIGWMYIVFQQPFAVSDTIEIDGKVGDVYSIDLFTTRMRLLDENFLPTGTSIAIPNEKFIYSEITNYSYPTEMIWDSVEFSFTYESNIKNAEKLLVDTIAKAISPFKQDISKVFSTRKEYLKYRKEFPMVYKKPRDSGIVVGAKYLVPLSMKFETKSFIIDQVISKVKKMRGVEFAYPHVVVLRKNR